MRNQDDRETNKVLTEQEKIKSLVDSEGWGVVKSKLLARLTDAMDIGNIDDSSPEKLLTDIRARKIAVGMVWDWLKMDVEGTAEQYVENKPKHPNYLIMKREGQIE